MHLLRGAATPVGGAVVAYGNFWISRADALDVRVRPGWDQPAEVAWLSLCLLSRSSIVLNSSVGILWIRCIAASAPSP